MHIESPEWNPVIETDDPAEMAAQST